MDADEVTAPEADAAAPTEPAGSQISEPAEAAPAAGPQLEPLLAEMTGKLDSLDRVTHELVRMSDRRDSLIDKLHEENQRLRAGEIAQAQAPVIREFIRTYDLVVDLQQPSEAPRELEVVRRRLLDGLAQVGVRPIVVREMSEFDSRQHAAIGSEPTADPHADMRIHSTARAGFVIDGERVVRPAEVRVWRHERDTAADEEVLTA